jgi:hypothetical protein
MRRKLTIDPVPMNFMKRKRVPPIAMNSPRRVLTRRIAAVKNTAKKKSVKNRYIIPNV